MRALTSWLELLNSIVEGIGHINEPFGVAGYAAGHHLALALFTSSHIDDNLEAACEAELVVASALLTPSRQIDTALEYLDAAVTGIDHESPVGGFIDGKIGGPQQKPIAAVLMRFGIAADDAAGRGTLRVVVHD